MDVLGINLTMDKIVANIFPFLTNVIFAIVIFVVGKWLAKKIVAIVEKILQKSKVDHTLVSFLGNVLYGLLLALVILTALSKLGVNTTSAVAILGGAALAVGMALQGQLASFAAGVMIILFRPFKVGDYVEVNGTEGTVKEIHIISTRLLTLDNNSIIIPNNNITTNSIINYTDEALRRVNLTIGISYNANIQQSRDVMLGVVHAHPNVLKDPAAAIKVVNLGDSSVDLAVLAWVHSPQWLDTKLDLTEQIKVALDNAGIEIPFPQRSVHITGFQEATEKLVQQN